MTLSIAGVQTRATSGNAWNGGEDVRIVIGGVTPSLPFTVATSDIPTPQLPLYWKTTQVVASRRMLGIREVILTKQIRVQA